MIREKRESLLAAIERQFDIELTARARETFIAELEEFDAAFGDDLVDEAAKAYAAATGIRRLPRARLLLLQVAVEAWKRSQKAADREVEQLDMWGGCPSEHK